MSFLCLRKSGLLGVFPYFLTGLVFLFSFLTVFPLDPHKLISQFSHTKWSAKDGIPGVVRAITQTPDGYLWLGTENGLYRFDGFQFTKLESSLESKLPISSVLSLFTARDGSLWIGFGSGKISHLLNGKLTNYSTKDDVPEGDIFTIVEDQNGTIWAGGPYGFVKFDGEKWHRVSKESGYLASGVQTLLVDKHGNLWAATDGFNYGFKDSVNRNTILKLGKNKSEFEGTGEGVGMVWQIKEAPDGNIWITDTSGDHTRPIMIKENNKQKNSNLARVMVLHFEENTLWIGTSDQGIFRTKDYWKLEKDTFDKFTINDGFSEIIYSDFKDREGNIWFGTENGLNRFRENKVTSFSADEGLPLSKQLAVISNNNEIKFFSYTQNSILDFHNGKFSTFILPTYSSNDSTRILSFYADKDGTLWLGGSFGLAKKVGEKFSFIQNNGIEKGAMVEAIVKDKDENIWFTLTGTDSIQRVVKLKNDELTELGDTENLPKYRCRILFADSIGKVWFGFENGIVAIYENRKFQSYSTKNGLPSGKILVITNDKKGNTLIGSEGGLSRFENGRFATLTKENGLLGNSVSGIVEDDDGFVWLATSSAILRVSLDELEKAFTSPLTYKLQGTFFDANDGLRGVPRQREPFPNATRASDGKLWFTTTGGVAVIDPRNWHKNRVLPTVKIEQIKADEQIPSVSSDLKFQPNTKNIQLHYTALSLSDPEKIQFRYKLEGYDKDWRDSGNIREVSYTNLPPGKYQFRVIACNNDGVWNEEGSFLDFTILPAFYQTKWFILLCLFVFVGLALVLYQRRVQKVKNRLNMQFEERLSERTRIARELHDSLLQGIVSASMQLNIVVDNLPQNSKTRPHLNRVINLIGEVIKEGRNTLHGLRSIEDSSRNLEQSFSQIPQILTFSEDRNFRIIVIGTPYEICTAVRDEIYLIGREAIINAFHHSKAQNIEVELEFIDKHFRLLIRDDGCGINPKILESEDEGHWGLVGMRERAVKIGAKLKIYSQDKVGTEIELFVPNHIVFENRQGKSSLSWVKKIFSSRNESNELNSPNEQK